jgi:Protein of unknown function (DUF3551)
MGRPVLLAVLAIASTFAAIEPVTARPEAIQDRYCLQGRVWGYPGNCQFSSYAQCNATASGTDAYCGINPHYAFALQRERDARPRPRVRARPRY